MGREARSHDMQGRDGARPSRRESPKEVRARPMNDRKQVDSSTLQNGLRKDRSDASLAHQHGREESLPRPPSKTDAGMRRGTEEEQLDEGIGRPTRPRQPEPAGDQDADDGSPPYWVYIPYATKEVGCWKYLKARCTGVLRVAFQGPYKAVSRECMAEMISQESADQLVQKLLTEGVQARAQATKDFPDVRDPEWQGEDQLAISRAMPVVRATAQELERAYEARMQEAEALQAAEVAVPEGPTWVAVRNVVPEAQKRPLEWFQKRCGQKWPSPVRCSFLSCTTLPSLETANIPQECADAIFSAEESSVILAEFLEPQAANAFIAAVEAWKLGMPKMKAQEATPAQIEAKDARWVLVRDFPTEFRNMHAVKTMCNNVVDLEMGSAQDAQAAVPSTLTLADAVSHEKAKELCKCLATRKGCVPALITEAQKNRINEVIAEAKRARSKSRRRKERSLDAHRREARDAQRRKDAPVNGSGRRGDDPAPAARRDDRRPRSRDRERERERDRERERERERRRSHSNRKRSREHDRRRSPVGRHRSRSAGARQRGLAQGGSGQSRALAPLPRSGRRERSWTLTRPGPG